MFHPVKLCSATLLSLVIGCSASKTSETAEEGERIRFFRVADGFVECFQTTEAENRLFDTKAEWEDFFSANVTCQTSDGTPSAAPVFDFDRYVLVMTLLGGECDYSGCGSIFPLVDGMVVEEGQLKIFTREPYPEELLTCLACVQPRELVLVERPAIDGLPTEFIHDGRSEGYCEAPP